MKKKTLHAARYLTRKTRKANSSVKRNYRRLTESRLTRAGKLILGRTGAGFAGRTVLLATGVGAAGLGVAGGSLVKSVINTEQATRAIRDVARGVNGTSKAVGNTFGKAINFIPNQLRKVSRYM